MLNTKILPKKVYNTNLSNGVVNNEKKYNNSENRFLDENESDKKNYSSHSENQKNNYFLLKNEEIEKKHNIFATGTYGENNKFREQNNSYKELSEENNDHKINFTNNDHKINFTNNDNRNNFTNNDHKINFTNNDNRNNFTNNDNRNNFNNDATGTCGDNTQKGGFYGIGKKDLVIWNEDRNIYIIYNENIPEFRPEEERIDCFISNDDIVNAIVNPEVENPIVSKYLFMITYNRVKKQFEFNFLKTQFTKNLEMMVKLQNYIYDILMSELSPDDEDENTIKENLMIFYYQLTIFLFKSIIPIADFYSDKDKISKIISFITFRYSSLILKNIMIIKEENNNINNKLDTILEIKNNIYSKIVDIGNINFTDQSKNSTCNCSSQKNKNIYLRKNNSDRRKEIENMSFNPESEEQIVNMSFNPESKEIFNYTNDNLFKNIENIINDKNLKFTDNSRKNSLDQNSFKSDNVKYNKSNIEDGYNRDDEQNHLPLGVLQNSDTDNFDGDVERSHLPFGEENNYAEIACENDVPEIIEDTISTKNYNSTNNSLNNSLNNSSIKSKKSSFKFKNLIKQINNKVFNKFDRNEKSFNPESAYNNSKVFNFIN